MIIAIDFDGTCVTHDFPNVGKEIGAAPILRDIVANGHKLILFTMRSHKVGISPVTNMNEYGGLDDAIGWFKNHNIPLFGVNENPEQHSWTDSPKPYAQLYIDDAALGCPLIHPANTSLPQTISKELSGRVYVAHDRPYVDWYEINIMLKKQGIIK